MQWSAFISFTWDNLIKYFEIVGVVLFDDSLQPVNAVFVNLNTNTRDYFETRNVKRTVDVVRIKRDHKIWSSFRRMIKQTIADPSVHIYPCYVTVSVIVNYLKLTEKD